MSRIPAVRRTLGIAVAAGTAVAAACAPAVRADRDESIPIPHGATWAWSPLSPPPPADSTAGPPARGTPPGPPPSPPWLGRRDRGRVPDWDAALFMQRVRRAVESAMPSRGLTRVDDPAHADFLLGFDLGDGGRRGPGRGGVAVGVGVGFGGPWGWYRPWGWGLYGWPGLYRPWGWFVPWGWGSWYGAWDWYAPYGPGPGSYGHPVPYREARLVLWLRERASGGVAYRATYTMDVYDMQDVSQAGADRIADKLLKKLT